MASPPFGSDALKAFILKQGADGVPVAEILRRAGINQATFFNRRRNYDGLLPTGMKRLKQLEDENGRLRKPVAGLSLEREMLQDVIRRTEGPRAKALTRFGPMGPSASSRQSR